MGVDYKSYLKLDQLLELQDPLSPKEHDETLFIIIHQVYELWFKQTLHEGDALMRQLQADNLIEAQFTLKRMLVIMKTMVGQTDILETMTPLSFSSFRSRLDRASGFQSAQFRQIEFFLGAKDPKKLAQHPEPWRERLEQQLHKPSVFDAFTQLLSRRGYAVPKDILERDVSTAYEGNQEMQAILKDIYLSKNDVAVFCEYLVDLDEGLQEWRYRHVKMVERTIGAKMGTGGSAGLEFLKNSLFVRMFPDLWAIRSEF